MSERSLGEYSLELFGEEDDFLRQIREEATENGIPTIQVPMELARLLAVLVVQVRPRSVLEIGTLFGYSGIVMGRVLPPEGRIVSLEVNPKHASIARENFARAGIHGKVEVLEGPGVDRLPTLEGRIFDLVFIDADKRSYPEYLRWALALTRPGSVIVADNVWRGGSIFERAEEDEDARGILDFNRQLANDQRLVSTFIPTRDGEDAASVSVVRER